MKPIYLLLLLFLLSAHTGFAQEDTTEAADTEVYEEDNIDLDYSRQDPFRLLDTLDFGLGLSAATMPFMHQQAFGAGLDLQLGYTQNLSAGVSFSIAGRKVNPKFGYNIGESKLVYYDISLYQEIKALQWKRLTVAFRVNAGYAAFHLSDNSIKEKYWWYDEYGNAYQGERALAIAANHFFKVAPAIHLRYQLAYRVALEGSAAYNFYFGHPEYGQRADFNNYMVQLGVKIGIN